MSHDSTVVCVLTPSGRGAVAVVAVEGSAGAKAADHFFRAANKRTLDQQPLDRIVYGHWIGSKGNDTSDSDTASNNTDGEDLVVCRLSETKLEIHCHGGVQSSAQIVGDLTSVGCEVVEPQEWLGREYECPLQAAAHFALGQATSFRTASTLLDQYHGALRNEIEAIAADLARANASAAAERIERLLEFAEFGRHLTEPWRVVIAGRPNVGKSSLINALVGFQRAIVFDQPGTTRDVVSAQTAIEGWPVELSDTAGLHETDDSIETAGIALARKRLAAADLVVWVLDAVDVVATGGISELDLAQQQADEVGVELDTQHTLIVINKTDLVEQSTDDTQGSVKTCAVDRRGIDQLLTTIANHLVPKLPESGSAVLFRSKQAEVLQAALNALKADSSDAAKQRIAQLLTMRCVEK